MIVRTARGSHARIDGHRPGWLASRSVLVGPVEPSGPELRRRQRVRGVTWLRPRRAGEKSY